MMVLGECKRRYNNSPKSLRVAQKGMILHTFKVRVAAPLNMSVIVFIWCPPWGAANKNYHV